MKLIFWWHHDETAIEVILLRFFRVLTGFLYHYMYNCFKIFAGQISNFCITIVNTDISVCQIPGQAGYDM